VLYYAETRLNQRLVFFTSCFFPLVSFLGKNKIKKERIIGDAVMWRAFETYV
jgi:hypothetical protein